MDCCVNQDDNKKESDQMEDFENPPKSFIGKYLYKLGKKDIENEKRNKSSKSGCC